MDNNQNIVIDENIVSSHRRIVVSKSFIVGVIYLVIVISFVLFKIANSLFIFQGLSDVVSDLLASCILQIIIIAGFPILLYTLFCKQSFRQTFKDFSFKKISVKSFGYAVIIGVLVFILNNYIASFFGQVINFFGAEPAGNVLIDKSRYSVPMFFLTILLSAVLPAICEEIAHRGLIVGGLKKYGVALAIVVSSVGFGLLHMNIYQCFYAILIGLLLAYICISTGSVFPCMIIHFMNNFLNTLFDFSYVNGWFGGGFYAWEQSLRGVLGNFGMYFLSVIIFIGCAFGLIYLVYKIIVKERIEKEANTMNGEDLEYFVLGIYTAYQNGLVDEKSIRNKRVNYYISMLFVKSKIQKRGVLEILENPNGKAKLGWKDMASYYTAIIISGFLTLYSFINLVL